MLHALPHALPHSLLHTLLDGTMKVGQDRPPEWTLDALAADPTQIQELPPEAVPPLLGELERLKAILWARMLTVGVQENGRAEVLARDRPAPPAAPIERPAPDSPGRAEAPLLSAKETARLLSCSEAAVRKWVARRRLPTLKVGRLVRFRLADVEAFLARGGQPPTAGRP